MSSHKEFNKRLAGLHLELSSLLSDQLLQSRLELEEVLSASHLTADEIEEIEEGDTTDFAKIAALCAALDLTLTLRPDFSVDLVRLSLPRVTFEPNDYVRWADEVSSSTRPMEKRRLETSVSEATVSGSSATNTRQLVHAS